MCGGLATSNQHQMRKIIPFRTCQRLAASHSDQSDILQCLACEYNNNINCAIVYVSNGFPAQKGQSMHKVELESQSGLVLVTSKVGCMRKV